ncbi:ComF family protein [Candidatus Dojkabacteria bacterium]|nr:ComF family protein [Candidatus Dojkabacteria bacterium]
MIRTFFKKVEDLLFPKVCEGCGEIGAYLCESCMRKKIEFVKVQSCHVCKKKIKNVKLRIKSCMVHEECKSETNLDGVFVVAKYSKFIEDFIGDIKYEFYFAMVDDLVEVINRAYGRACSCSVAVNFRKVIKRSIITFIPLNPWRKRWRGFNQSELIAKKLAEYWKVDCKELLKRIKNTRKQVGLKRRERLKNLKDAFMLEENIVFTKGEPASGWEWLDGRTVVIVDDVMTTGATLEECSKILKEAGVNKVYGLVFARG